MVPRGSWPEVFQAAAIALEDSLYQMGALPEGSEFNALYLHTLNHYYSNRESSHRETGTLPMLANLLAKVALRPMQPEEVEQALDAFYTITRQNWQMDPSTPVVLKAIYASGLRIGMASNAGNEVDVLKLLDGFGIRPYFDYVTTSFACGYRKPHTAIFESAASHWDIPPRQLLMVGDRADTDVLGGKTAGMRTAWLNRYNRRNNTPGAIPDVELRTLADLTTSLALVKT